MAQCQHHINKGAVNKFSTGKNIYIYIFLFCKSNIVLFQNFFFFFSHLYSALRPVKEGVAGKNHEHIQNSDYKSISLLLHCWSKQEKPNILAICQFSVHVNNLILFLNYFVGTDGF